MLLRLKNEDSSNYVLPCIADCPLDRTVFRMTALLLVTKFKLFVSVLCNTTAIIGSLKLSARHRASDNELPASVFHGRFVQLRRRVGWPSQITVIMS